MHLLVQDVAHHPQLVAAQGAPVHSPCRQELPGRLGFGEPGKEARRMVEPFEDLLGDVGLARGADQEVALEAAQRLQKALEKSLTYREYSQKSSN